MHSLGEFDIVVVITISLILSRVFGTFSAFDTSCLVSAYVRIVSLINSVAYVLYSSFLTEFNAACSYTQTLLSILVGYGVIQ